MVMILREVAANGAVTNHEIGTVNQFSVTPGSTYSIIDSETGQPVEDVVLTRNGDDLLIELDGETIASLEGYYVDGTNVSFYDNSAYAGASEGGAAWEVSESQAANGGLIAGVFGGILAGVAGSDSDATAAPVNPTDPGTDPTTSTITVNAVAGPFITTVGVNVYSTDGTLLTTLNHDFSTGPVDIELEDYSGPILVEVFDINGNTADYRDEGTDSNRSLTIDGVGSTLRAMASADSDGNASVSVTPLTELAAMLAGIGSNNTVSEEQLGNNARVAQLFGLEDILAEINTIFDAGFSTADGTSAAEAYGILLSIISGLDQILGSATIADTLTALFNAISEDGEGNLVLNQQTISNMGAAANLIQQTQSGSGISDDDIDDAVSDSVADNKPATIVSVVVTAAGQVQVTYSEDVSGSEPAASDFTLVLNDETIGFTDAAVNGNVISLTPAEGIQGSDTVGNLAYTPSDGSVIDGADNESVTQTVPTVVNNSVGIELILDKAFSTLTTSELEGISQTGAAGDDLLSVNIYSGSEDTGIYSLDIEQSGDAGDDFLSVDLSGEMIGDANIPGFDYNLYAYSTTTSTTTSVTTLGYTTKTPTSSIFTFVTTGFDTVTNTYTNTNTLSDSGFVATGDPRGNIVALVGASGNDTLSVNFNATADEVSQIPGDIYYSASVSTSGTVLPPVPTAPSRSEGGSESYIAAYAAVSGNSVSLDGGTGDDMLNVGMHAFASVPEGFSDVFTYQIQTGPSSFATKTTTVTTASAHASIANNEISAEGGAGNDSISVSLVAEAYQVPNTMASSESDNGAMASLAANDIYALGGSGTADTIAVTLSARAQGNFEASAGIYGGESSGPGGPEKPESPSDYNIIASGNDVNIALMANASAATSADAEVTGMAIYALGSDIDIDLSAHAMATGSEASAEATVSENNLDIYGGAASDLINVDLHAQATAYGYTVGASVDYNNITIDAGAGADQVSVNFLAEAYLKNGTSYYASASVDSNSVSIDGGTGNDDIYVGMHAVASATYVSSYHYYEAAEAAVSDNDVTVMGGEGADTITVDLDAQANVIGNVSTEATYVTSSQYAEASVSGNDITVAAGAGDDVINISLNATATGSYYAFNTDSDEYVYAEVSENYVSVDAGSGNDIVNLDFQALANGNFYGGNSYTSQYVSADVDNTATVYAGDGNDQIYANMLATANALFSNASASEYEQYATANIGADLYLYGDTGNDTIDVNVLASANASFLNATAASDQYAFASADGDMELIGGMGNDLISLDITARAAANFNNATITSSYQYAAAEVSEFNIVLGTTESGSGAGNDSLVVNLNATAVATLVDAYGYSSQGAWATVSGNSVSAYAGDGTDNIQLKFAANAQANFGSNVSNNGTYQLAYAEADSNNIYAYGGDGADNIAVTLSANATGNFADTAINSSQSVTAYVRYNDVEIYGGSGADTLSVLMQANAVTSGADSAQSSVYSNNIAIYGGAGTDVISLDFSAGGAFGNNIFIAGGTGADVIDIQGDVDSASGNNFAFFYGSTGEFGDSIAGLSASLASANAVIFSFNTGLGTNTNVYSGIYTEAGSAYFYYDDFATSSYALYYDADGNGTGAASTVAAFTTDIGASNIDIQYSAV